MPWNWKRWRSRNACHLIRNASAVAEEKTGRGKQFSEQLKELLQQALALAAERTALTQRTIGNGRGSRQSTDVPPSGPVLRDQDNQTLLNGWVPSTTKDMCCGFSARTESSRPTTGGTGSAPAVIARKVSHCSRNERGARAFEAFTSVLQTIRKTNL